jgi:hypothetical protein
LWCCRCTIVGTDFISVSIVTRLVNGLPYRRHRFSPRSFNSTEFAPTTSLPTVRQSTSAAH